MLTDPVLVNNGYCAEFALEIIDSISNTIIWSNFFPRYEHVFVEIGGMFYDAECINGVRDLRDLPIWDRISLLERVDINTIIQYCQKISLKTL